MSGEISAGYFLHLTKCNMPFAEPVEMFPQLPALAERLGVKEGDCKSGMVLAMSDGRKYDAFAAG